MMNLHTIPTSGPLESNIFKSYRIKMSPYDLNSSSVTYIKVDLQKKCKILTTNLLSFPPQIIENQLSKDEYWVQNYYLHIHNTLWNQMFKDQSITHWLHLNPTQINNFIIPQTGNDESARDSYQWNLRGQYFQILQN